jgi:hypothetical protein
VFTISECSGGLPSCPVKTKTDGTFSGYFVSCDTYGTTHKHDADFSAILQYGQPYYSAPSQPWQFSTKPCSGVAPTHEKENLLK